MVRLLKSNPEEFVATYQLLCANCNWIKRLTQDSPEDVSETSR